MHAARAAPCPQAVTEPEHLVDPQTWTTAALTRKCAVRPPSAARSTGRHGHRHWNPAAERRPARGRRMARAPHRLVAVESSRAVLERTCGGLRWDLQPGL